MSAQRIHHKSPNSAVKQGPLKATLPVVSLYKQQGTSLRKSKSNSPTMSPINTWKTRSPDPLAGCPETNNTSYRGKSKTLSAGGYIESNSTREYDLDESGTGASSTVIRRTASLDTIYLKGQWPRDCFYMFNSLQIDKATQTDDLDMRRRQDGSNVLDRSADDKLKMIRHRLQRNTQGVQRDRIVHGDHTVQLTSSSQTTPVVVKASPVNIPVKPLARPPMRSSIEGLNQEIEGFVLKSNTGVPGALYTDRSDDDKFNQHTPEGHRAPLADLLRSTRSVNTQTPAAAECVGRSSHSSGGSQGSSPDHECGRLGTSPQINQFLAREPPDGCEKVSLNKVGEDSSSRWSTTDISPLKPNVTFQLKPSQGSAFYPLQQQSPQPSSSTSSTGDGDAVSNPLPFVPPDNESDRP